MKSLLTVGCFVLLAVLIGAVLPAGAQTRYMYFASGKGAKAVYTHKSIYFVMPPHSFNDPGMQGVFWSNDGRYVVEIRSNATTGPATIDSVIDDFLGKPRAVFTGFQVNIISVETGEKRQVLTTDKGALGDSVAFGPDKALLSYSRPFDEHGQEGFKLVSQGILVDLKQGTWRVLPDFREINGVMHFNVNPVLPQALVTVEKGFYGEAQEVGAPAVAAAGGGNRVRPYDSQNPDEWTFKDLTALVSLSGDTIKRWPAQIPPDVTWTQDGQSFFWQRYNRKTKVRTFWSIDESGKPNKMEPAPTPYEEKLKVPLYDLYTVTFSAQDVQKFGTVNGLFLKFAGKKQRPILVAPGATDFSSSPKQNATAYFLDGELKVSRIVKMSDANYAVAKKALKARALSNAKQAGLAVIMYSGDYDDLLPSSAAAAGGAVDPYLKSQEIWNSFTYTPPSNLNATQIAEPASTIMGYVEGPDGRAVVYTDGHAKWIEDPDTGDDDN